ncbi:hypothetical protein CCACVL1_06158 [Corchorus capsularis]|uniref:Uncharacterized protein n=1 Tax=Corchorus capsularis TaxID=210143 RepID=A0A1R3JH46_COCAP|nr:hypothetical protein CCACVL1_06158 [Corchorus capsularis]
MDVSLDDFDDGAELEVSGELLA